MAKHGLGIDIMTELKLGLPSACPSMKKNDKKRVFSQINDNENSSTSTMTTDDEPKNRNKTQVVGWPPVCSYRRKNTPNVVHQNKMDHMYVKVSMDGAAYLRKIDLNVHNTFLDLVLALEKLFDCSGRIGKQDSTNDDSDFIPIYADKEGDWMLVGDVPWTMFTGSCKRLRIMRRSEAKSFGLAY